MEITWKTNLDGDPGYRRSRVVLYVGSSAEKIHGFARGAQFRDTEGRRLKITRCAANVLRANKLFSSLAELYPAALFSVCVQCATCCAVGWRRFLGRRARTRRLTCRAFATPWKSRTWRHVGTTESDGRAASSTSIRTRPLCPRYVQTSSVIASLRRQTRHGRSACHRSWTTSPPRSQGFLAPHWRCFASRVSPSTANEYRSVFCAQNQHRSPLIK